METNNSSSDKTLKEQHPVSIKGIFNRYVKTKMLCSGGLRWSLLIALILILLVCCVGSHDIYFSFLNEVVDIALSLFPNLLGFCIGGYALIIGAGNMKKMSVPLPNNNMSYFQVLSSDFAMSLIIQSFILSLSYIVHIILKMELPAVSVITGKIVNLGMAFIVILCSLLSFSLLYYTVVNIFNFGQVTHFSIRFDENEKKDKKEE